MSVKITALNERASNEVHVAEVVRHGEKLIVPKAMPLASAINTLEQVMKDEETLIQVAETIDCFPFEGAIAFRQAIEEMFGYSRTVATPGFFGPTPPSEISIETGVDTKTTAPWGRFHFALAESRDEYLEAGSDYSNGRIVFQLSGVVKKKFKNVIGELADLTRKIVLASSIYRGKALKIEFTDKEGQQIRIPKPRFIATTATTLSDMVYTQALTQLMDVNVMTPLRSAEACREAKIPLKRGILLAGPYGTGKSLFAAAVAKVATENAWTYIYIKNASELPQAINFAKMYQPAVIFAEDVDRHVTGERTDAMDTILNTLDGIDSKSTEIMAILTTNHLDQVNRAMLRPGRLDVILNITPPDAEAVERLVRVYGRDVVEADADLSAVGEVLNGQTPAVIREAVERSKLASISRTGDAIAQVNGEDLRVAAETLMQQQALLKPAEVKEPTWHKGMVQEIGQHVTESLKGNGLGMMETQIATMDHLVKDIHQATT